MDPLISVKHLLLKYDELKAVDDVSFELYPGEILAIIGPNGSGKTSMIECIEGLKLETSGEIRVLGKSIKDNRKEIYKRAGVQLQDVQYQDKIKVKELCELFCSFYDVPANWQILLSDLGLAAKKDSYVDKLSGGEKQRLSILLALIPKPQLLLLDELTTGLDPEIRRSMWDSLKAIRDMGVGILLISHYMEEVQFLADRVLLMIEGKAAFIGSLSGLREYAQSVLPEDMWKSDLSLEEIYLLLVPQKDRITMEALL